MSDHSEFPVHSPVSPIVPAILFAVAVLYGWWRYFAARIVTDDQGITQQTLLGPKRILWADVKDVKVNGVDVSTRITIVGAKERVWFSTLIADSEELIAEISRHRTNTDEETAD